MHKNSLLLLVSVVLVVLFLGLSFLLSPSSKKEGQKTTNSTQTEKKITEESVKPKMESADLEGVNGFEGNGTAINILDKTIFSHSLVAEVADPPTGKFYEGWLVQKKPTTKFISTGKLEKKGNNYSLTFTSEENYFSFPAVVITLETESNGLDNQPETHVLEGSF